MLSTYDEYQLELMKKSLKEKGDHMVLFNNQPVQLSLLIKSIETVKNWFK